jgi:hypothetical protein
MFWSLDSWRQAIEQEEAEIDCRETKQYMSTGHANGPSGYLCIICTCVSVIWIRWYVGYHLTTRSISFSTLLDAAHTNTQYISCSCGSKNSLRLAIFSDYTYIVSMILLQCIDKSEHHRRTPGHDPGCRPCVREPK